MVAMLRRSLLPVQRAAASDMPATSPPLVFDLDGTLVDPEWLG